MGTCCSTLNYNEGNIAVTDRAKEKTLEFPKSLLNKLKKSPSDLYSMQKKTPSLFQDISDSCQSRQLLSMPNTNSCECGGSAQFSQSWLTLSPNFDRNCETCKRGHFKSFFLCDRCDTLTCSFCASMLGYSISFVYCDKNHKLKFYSDTAAYYNEKQGQKFYECRNCTVKKIGPSWSCRACMFDLCVECGRLEGLYSQFTELKCCMQHELRYKVLEEKDVKDFQCFECFRSKGKERVFCEECEFCYCVMCSILKLSQCFDVVRCGKGHKLQICSIFKLPKSIEWVLCVGCNLATMDLAYNCMECRVSLCLDCYDEAVKVKFKYKCKKCRCGGGLEFNLCALIESSCCICFEVLDASNFTCSACKSAICLNCISLL